MAKKLKSLREVTLEFPRTFIDTSALFYPMDGRPEKDDKSYEAQVLRSQMTFDSAIFYSEFLKSDGRFYVTSKVLKEYDNPSDYVSRIRERMVRGKHLSEQELDLFYERVKDNQGRMKLAEMLKSKGMVLQLTEDELKEYVSFCKKYDNIRSKEGIGGVDFNLLISVAVVSKMRKPHTCLISNDFGILYSLKDLRREEKARPERFGFFLRKEFDVFERSNL